MLIPLLVLAAGLVMMLVEWRRPGRSLPAVAGWWGRAILFNLIQAGVAFAGSLLWEQWMAEHRPWDAHSLGLFWGPLLGYVAVTFIYYWWHRARHHLPLLWRWLHQFHHSPQRIEIITSFYKHPFEVLVNGLLSSAICVLLVGLDPTQTAITVLLTGWAELFYHWNVKTPYWLGFFFQRPEMHAIHHEAGRHRSNYSDLPLWDICFGTFQNPRSFPSACGFGEREHAVMPMLLGQDVHRAQEDVA